MQRFAGTGIPLGVLPFGTYNLLAHDLGMSTDLDEAVRQIAHAEEKQIDLGRVGRRLFHTLGGLGYFSRVARQRAEVRKTISNRLVGAAVAAVRSLTRGGNLDVEVEAEGLKESFRTPAALVTNNLLQPGSWRRARLDQGVLEINIVRGDIALPLLRGGVAAFMGSWRDSTEIVSWRSPWISLSFRRPRVFVNLDGEVDSPTHAAAFRDHAESPDRARGSCSGRSRGEHARRGIRVGCVKGPELGRNDPGARRVDAVRAHDATRTLRENNRC